MSNVRLSELTRAESVNESDFVLGLVGGQTRIIPITAINKPVNNVVSAGKTITLQINGDFLLVTGRGGSQGTLYYKCWDSITPLITHGDVIVTMSGDNLSITNNGGATLAYSLIKLP